MNINNGFIDGCFDLLHYGHINSFFQSKKKCNILHLATHTNDDIFNAKNNFPIFNFEHRLLLLQNCKFIDICYNDPTPYNTNINILDNLNCEYFFHSEDGIDKYPLLDLFNSNKLLIINRTKGISTSLLLNRLFKFINNMSFNTNTNYQYLTNIYNDMVLYNNPIRHKNIIFIKCNWDLFNENHIYLLNNIKTKYYDSYDIYIDLTDTDEILQSNNNIFNKYETRILLYGIKLIYDIIIDIDYKNINCNNLITINTNVITPFKFNKLLIDDEFNDYINNLDNIKLNIINNINFDDYQNKLNSII
jgi:cytidyltransferase-like protein